MRNLILFLTIVSVTPLYGQGLDYLNLSKKDTLLSVCMARDSSDVSDLVLKLESITADSITKNRHLYHYELGMTYYRLSAYRSDTNYMRKAVHQMENALKIDPYYPLALWGAALMHMFLNDCAPALYYINLYQKLSPKKEYDKSGMKWIKKRCSE